MSKANRRIAGNQAAIVIKKEEVVEAAGHGGAWKVAYADFVTAMMAFFLLMWLLNATTEDQRKGLADYFSPNSLLSHASSGTGNPFGGHTAFDRGALVSDRGAVQALVGSHPTPLDPSDADANPDSSERAGTDDDQGPGADQQTPPLAPPPPGPTTTVAPPHPPPSTADGGVGSTVAIAPSGAPPSLAAPAAAPVPATVSPPNAESPTKAALPRSTGSVVGAPPREPTDAEIQAAQDRREKVEFDKAAQQIRNAVGSDQQLAGLAKQLVIDMTPEGLRIQILDSEQRPMFPFGSAEPNERAKLLLEKVTPVLMRLPQEISIAGNTDAAPFPGPDRTNWELSTERANATRRLLMEGGLSDARIRSVTGNADRDLLLPKDPLAAANRRIAIIVLRGTGQAASASAPPAATAPGTVAR
ncbi:MAG TPA: flagellar motor protein MotB [Acetobacteraceae bacterium]|nr:flagellar motor protein MotB [Acetobacteraceae bacterium]